MDASFLLGLLLIGLMAGAMGTFFGVGGGVIVVPALTILYGLTAQQSAAISLVGIATASSYAASYFIRRDMVNIRLGMVLLVGTVIGSVTGALVAIFIEQWILLGLFSLVVFYSAFYMIRNPERLSVPIPEGSTDKIPFVYSNRMDVTRGFVQYRAKRVPSSIGISGMSGALSSLIGIGGGSVNVPMMNVWMGIPMKIATSTSSFMISVTAMSGAIIYYLGGILLPTVAAAVALGMFVGSYVGSHSVKYFDSRTMRKYFSIFMAFLAVISLLKAGGLL